jgi:hypothetical protein
MDPNIIAEHMRKYANSTGDDGIRELAASCDEIPTAGYALRRAVPCNEISACAIKLASAIQSSSNKLLEWKCLCLMSDRYGGLVDMITNFAESPASRPMLLHCGTIISNSHVDEELGYCFLFLDAFMGESWNSGRVYGMTSLRGALFSYLSSERFRAASCRTQAYCLWAFRTIANLFRLGPRENDGSTLLQDGALCAITRAAVHAFGTWTAGCKLLLMLFRSYWTSHLESQRINVHR